MDEIPKIKKRSASYSRTKGHNSERLYVNKFKELGFPYCKTSRLASRLLDDCGIDLSGIPMNVQIKCGYENARPRADVLFSEMKRLLSENFPPTDPIHKYPKILIHKMNGHYAEKQLVSMTWDDFVPFLLAYKEKHGL